MKKLCKATLLALPLLLTACDGGGMRDTLGLSRTAPDEFTVVSRPPLSVPPEFNLRPPKAGEAPLGLSSDEQARSLLTGKPGTTTNLVEPMVETAVTPVVRTDALSGGAASLLKRAGAQTADDGIRSKLGEDAAKPADTSNAKTLLEQIDGTEKNEPTVDAKKEAERLRANKDAGKSITEGDVPTEGTKSRSLLERIF